MNIKYNEILNAIKDAVIVPGFYWQLLAVFICFSLTFVIYKISKRFFFFGIKNQDDLDRDSNFYKITTKYIAPLFLPTLMIILLSVGIAIFSRFDENAILFSTVIQLVALFLLLRFLHVFLGNSFIINVVAALLIPALILNIFDLLQPTIAYLDSYAIKMGSVRISIYTVIKAIIILLVVFWLSGLISKKSKNLIKKSKTIKISTKAIINKMIDITVYFVVFIVILRVFGVDMTTFAVIGGAVGVGIGFGLQKISSNFISGIILLFEKSVEVGDLVDLEDGNIFGTITHFSGRYTLIETLDGKEIMVPNEDFITCKVTNWTYNNNRARIDIKINISYDSNIKKAQELMIKSAIDHPRCLRYPTTVCYLTNFGEYAIEVTLYFWICDVLEGRLGPKSDVMVAILEQFAKNNITIQLPQKDLHIKDMSPIKLEK